MRTTSFYSYLRQEKRQIFKSASSEKSGIFRDYFNSAKYLIVLTICDV